MVRENLDWLVVKVRLLIGLCKKDRSVFRRYGHSCCRLRTEKCGLQFRIVDQPKAAWCDTFECFQ